MEAKFKVGDKVYAVAFTDCFGKNNPSTQGLTVVKVTLITDVCPCETHRVHPYYRVLAYKDGGLGCVEAGERMFAAE